MTTQEKQELNAWVDAYEQWRDTQDPFRAHQPSFEAGWKAAREAQRPAKPELTD